MFSDIRRGDTFDENISVKRGVKPCTGCQQNLVNEQQTVDGRWRIKCSIRDWISDLNLRGKLNTTFCVRLQVRIHIRRLWPSIHVSLSMEKLPIGLWKMFVLYIWPLVPEQSL